MMRWRMVRNTVVTAKKYTVGNVPLPQKNFPSYSTPCHSSTESLSDSSSGSSIDVESDSSDRSLHYFLDAAVSLILPLV